MTRTAFAFAALLALTGLASATDFATTLNHPVAPKVATAEKTLDFASTGSIRPTDKTVKPTETAPSQPNAPRDGGIYINPWIVPSFH